MKSSRRFRWLPRFSLSNLLMLMVVVGLSLACHDQRRKIGEQAEAIAKQRLEIRRLTVESIVSSAASNAQKARALAPFIKVGDKEKDIEKWCGDCVDAEISYGLARTARYAAGLEIQCLNGVVSDFGYLKRKRPGKLMFVSLGHEVQSESLSNNE